jgi:hypothetical protein
VPAGGAAVVHDDVRVECAGAAVFSVTFARSPDVPASGTVSHSPTRNLDQSLRTNARATHLPLALRRQTGWNRSQAAWPWPGPTVCGAGQNSPRDELSRVAAVQERHAIVSRTAPCVVLATLVKFMP